MSLHDELQKDGYSISTDLLLLNRDFIYDYLSKESYWAAGIPRDVFETSINNSLVFGLYHDKVQIGFARVVTDKATFAYLADVFVITDYRGKGLSKWLIASIQDHPELQGLRRWMLGTRDAHGLYEQFGWTHLDEQVSKRFMQRHFPDVYLTKKEN